MNMLHLCLRYVPYISFCSMFFNDSVLLQDTSAGGHPGSTDMHAALYLYV